MNAADLLLASTMKVSVVLLVAFGVVGLLRRRSAALRHWVLAAAIVSAALTPMLELVVPAWHLRLSAWTTPRADDPSASIAPREAPLADAPGTAAQPPRAGLLRALGAASWIAPLWLAGVAVNLLILLVGLARLWWLSSRSRPVHQGRWKDLATEISRAHGVTRAVRLLHSDHPTLLVTWGLVDPAIILPARAGEWPDARLRIVLSHELAHIGRRDWVVQLTAELLRSIYWFNPLLWIACRLVRDESEHACDDAVLRQGVAGPDYAGHLLAVARAFRSHRHMWLPAPAIARPSSLERRVRAMLNARLDRAPITRSACIAAAVLFLGVAIPVAGFAAAPSAIVSGTIVDQMGKVVPDVTVSLSDPRGAGRHEVHSNQSGQFEFVALPAGDYVFETTRMGFTSLREPLTLSGPHVQHDVTLELGTVQETITVRAGDAPRTVRGGSTPPHREEAADPCASVPTGGCIRAPLKLRDVRPEYPEGLRQAAVEGEVHLEGRIAADGSVIGMQAIEPADPAFASAAIDAVNQWLFSPTHLDGQPVETHMNVHVAFKVHE